MREWRHLQRSTKRKTHHPVSAVLVCFREMRPGIRRHIDAAIAVHCSNVTLHKSEQITGKIRGPNTECVARSFKRLPGTVAFQNSTQTVDYLAQLYMLPKPLVIGRVEEKTECFGVGYASAQAVDQKG